MTESFIKNVWRLRQPLQPKILLSMMEVLTSRTASSLPGSQPALHPQAPLGMMPAEEQHRTTSYPKARAPCLLPCPHPDGALKMAAHWVVLKEKKFANGSSPFLL